jgi:choline transport protein
MPDPTVPVKDVGTQADINDMERSGRKQDTRRLYNHFQIFGFGCTLIATAEVHLASFQLGLNNGGTAGLFWGFVVVVVVLYLVYMSLSEMASMVNLHFRRHIKIVCANGVV